MKRICYSWFLDAKSVDKLVLILFVIISEQPSFAVRSRAVMDCSVGLAWCSSSSGGGELASSRSDAYQVAQRAPFLPLTGLGIEGKSSPMRSLLLFCRYI